MDCRASLLIATHGDMLTGLPTTGESLIMHCFEDYHECLFFYNQALSWKRMRNIQTFEMFGNLSSVDS